MSNFKPMLFSTDMVRAILDGTKTQTRRIIKPQPKNYTVKSIIDRCNFKNGNWCIKHKIQENPDRFEITDLMKSNLEIGNIIWVRETFGYSKEGKLYFAANVCNPKYAPENGWKPSLFMPKELCRLFLEVTGVRIERLNEISESDSILEGIQKTNNGFINYDKSYPVSEFIGGGTEAIRSYVSLWESINGKNSWSENPFVWVYTFKVVDRPHTFR